MKFASLSIIFLLQSASASLSFLSQLNRLSEKSRARYAEAQAKQKASASPQQAPPEGDDQQVLLANFLPFRSNL